VKKIILMLFITIIRVPNAFAMMKEVGEEEIEWLDEVRNKVGNDIKLSPDGKKIIATYKDGLLETEVSMDLKSKKFQIECCTSESLLCGFCFVRKDKHIVKELKKRLYSIYELIPLEYIQDFVLNGNRKYVDECLWKV
jgi:hypothetical protein